MVKPILLHIRNLQEADDNWFVDDSWLVGSWSIKKYSSAS